MKFFSTAAFYASALVFVLVGCAAEAELGDAILVVAVNCANPECGPLEEPVKRGDTAFVYTFFRDPTPDEADLPRTRAICDVNIEIRDNQQGGRLAATMPLEPWCVDSVLVGGDNWPGSTTTGHLYLWPVPENFPAGKYSVTTVLLDHPRIARTTTIEIK
jgi:hypothetical protein